MQTVAEVISSGLVPRLVPHLDLSDLQSLVNVDRTLRKLLDTLAEPDWAGIRARIVPSGHYLVGVTSGRHQAICRYFATQHAITAQHFGTLSATLKGRHISQITCEGDLIAIFTEADHKCRRDRCLRDYGEYDSMKEHVLCLDGHVSLFALTVQGHVHVIKYPGWFNPDWEHIMRRKWSHDSTQLLVYWRDDDHQRMHIACLSKDALAEREFTSSGCAELCMLGPDWSLCSQFVPMYQTGGLSHLYVLNTKLETVMTFGKDECTYPHMQFWLPGQGNLVSAWAPNGTLVASADTWPYTHRLNLCWHPSGHPEKEATAAQASALLAELSSSESLQSLTWSTCGGLAAVCVMYETDDIGRCRKQYPVLYVLVPGQPLASMKMGSASRARDAAAWSPAGDRLLVCDEEDVELVTCCCTSVQRFTDSMASFSPCSHFLAIVEYGDVALRVCMADDGSEVFILSGCSISRTPAKFNALGDVLILAGYDDIRTMCFGWGATSSMEYCQQICSKVAAACRMVATLPHSCCDPTCRWT